MSKDVTIDAGLSGRGYLNRLLYLSKEETVSLDRDENLIRQLRKEPSYMIRFGSGWEPLEVGSYAVYTIMDERAITNITQAERIFISVGVDYVVGLLPPPQAALQERDRRSLDILVVENEVQPSSPLAVSHSDSRVHLSETIIFCTTLGQRDLLNIFNGNLNHLSYDSVALGHEFLLHDFVQEMHLSDLLKHKIYTYNCISAYIVYLGYEGRYTDYAEAANDIEITEKIKRIAEVTNRCITTVYNVSMQEQTAFSEMMTRKFQSQNIKDAVARGVRDVERKLKPEERIRRPLSLVQGQREYSRELLEVLAVALRYDTKTKELSQDRDKLVDFYAQGMCEGWKQVLHRCK